LVLAGAFDSLGGTRSQNFLAIQEALEFGGKVQTSKNSTVDSLFGASHDTFADVQRTLPNVPAWEVKDRLAKEREVLGFYLTDHPLRKYEAEYNSFASVHLGEEETYNFKEPVRAIGVVTDFRTKMDKRGNNMAFFKLDDFSGSCECLMFSKVYAKCENLILPESTILVKGNLESSGDAIKLHVDEAMPLSEVKQKLTKSLGIIVDSSLHDKEKMLELKKILEEHPGKLQVVVALKDNGTNREFLISNKVSISDELISKLTLLLGDDCVRFFPT
jgi:DNA polymerase-3 subunit alpha